MQNNFLVSLAPTSSDMSTRGIPVEKNREKNENPISQLALNQLQKMDHASVSTTQPTISDQNWVEFLQKNCDDLYEKIFLHLDTIESISQVSKENNIQAKQKGLFKILIAKMIKNALKIKGKNPHILSEIAKVIACHDLPQALLVTNHINAKDWKSYALCEIAIDQVKKSHHEALQIAKRVSTPLWKTKAFAHMANVIADKNPSEAKILLESAFKESKSLSNTVDKQEAIVIGLHALHKVSAQEASNLKQTLIQEAQALKNESDTDKWHKVKALVLLADYVIKVELDPVQAQPLLDLATEETKNIDTPIRKTDCLCSIAKAYAAFDRKKSKKIMRKALSAIHTHDPGIQALQAIKIIENLPFKKHNLIDELLIQAYYHSAFIEKQDDQGLILSKLAKIQSAIYPILAIQQAQKIQNNTHRALAYCFIAQSLQTYYN